MKQCSINNQFSTLIFFHYIDSLYCFTNFMKNIISLRLVDENLGSESDSYCIFHDFFPLGHNCYYNLIFLILRSHSLWVFPFGEQVDYLFFRSRLFRLSICKCGLYNFIDQYDYVITYELREFLFHI